jgi:autotransporter-associated beta strand protein
MTLAQAARIALLAGLSLATGSARAVIIYGGDGSGNTTAPSDDPGWANVGYLNGASCVYLGNGWVITAGHVGMGSPSFSSGSYADVPSSYARLVEPSTPSQTTDLCMFQLQANPSGLSTPTISSTEPPSGAQITAIGNGMNRATSETYWDANWNVVSGPVSGGYAGFNWGSSATKRWGTNYITQNWGSSVDDGNGITDGWETQFLPYGANYMQAAAGDSGGGVFYKSSSGWQLTGITLAIANWQGQPANTAVLGDLTFFADLSKYAGEITQIMAAPQPLYQSGGGNWNQNSTTNWSRVSGGSPIQPWTAGSAVFEGSAGTVTVASGGVASVNSITFTTDGYMLAGSGAITLTGAGGNITTGTGTDTIGCPLAGSVGLTKNGTGTLILTGANTYTGGTTIGAGTLQLGSGGTTGSISGNVVNNGVLAFNRSDNVTFSGNISGSGGLTQQGSGLLILAGTTSYTGVTNVQGGALQINGASSAMNVLTNANPTNHTGGTNVAGGFLVLDYSANTANESSLVSTVQSLLRTAYNGGSNSFQSGHDYQLFSTAASNRIGLGWVDNAATHQVTVMPALYGDANLDGVVDASDLDTVLANYDMTGASWSQGDFNYDGTVGFADLNKVLTNFHLTGPLKINSLSLLAFDSLEADSQAMQLLAGDGITISAGAVPEPSVPALLAGAWLGLAVVGMWRKRKQAQKSGVFLSAA